MPKASERAIALAKEVLAKIAAYDAYFPKPNESMLMAWAEHISLKNPNRDDMLAAVSKFYENNADGVKPLPASVTSIARAMRQDRMARGDYTPPPDKSADPEPPALPEGEKITMAEWEARHGVSFPKLVLRRLPEDDSFDGPNPLRVACPHCKASVGTPCSIPGTQQVLVKSRAHPKRVELAERELA